MAKDLMSQTSLRHLVQRIEQLNKPVAGSNSERLKAKRRQQMLEGKLGQEAWNTATKSILWALDEQFTFEQAQEVYDNYIQGKELTPNAEPTNSKERTEPTYTPSS